ncbi:hypothetical protein LUZ60_013795 [Juncus effusus]|nr:hypothetical protein LUZ60_013795 [Juncus effusus]
MNKRKGRDRLSDLPDSVLIEILSLLKSREVAQTCILSKRWEKLWASVPCLDFDFADFLSEEEEERTEEGLQSDIKRFKNFVSRFLDLREDDKDIERFKLKCDVTDSETRTGILLSARMWIRYALNHKAKNLHVMLTAPLEKFYMPDCFFICESLEEAYMDIKENSDFDNDPPNWYISAPNLEYLNIAEAVNFPSKLKDMSNVTKAVIATLNVSGHYYRELLSSLSGVKDMKLCHDSLEEYGFHDDEEDVPNVEQFERFECKTSR